MQLENIYYVERLRFVRAGKHWCKVDESVSNSEQFTLGFFRAIEHFKQVGGLKWRLVYDNGGNKIILEEMDG